jgi:formylglycine-generating enzyme required for sulfatase activity
MDPGRELQRGRVLGLCAYGLAEHPDVLKGDPLREGVRDAVARSFAESGARWPLADRLLALEGLGRLGDPRLAGDPWVEIEGGTFTMGDDRGAPNAVPARRETVPPFRIFSRPVTVQDYKPFVDAGGYREERWWRAGREEGEDVTEPADWAEQQFHPNRPVTSVSWYEAMAFCAWASAPLGLDVDLPGEVEWEFGARGPEGTLYPWGSDEPGEGDAARASYRWGDGSVEHATPVGAFPGGNRGRLLDLSGNVWEWCRDPWTQEGRPEPVDPARLRGAPRVARGGSWSSLAGRLRCAYRIRSLPWSREDNLGFRVVCRGSRQP